MTKKICKIAIAIFTSILFAVINYSALSYGGLITSKTYAATTSIEKVPLSATGKIPAQIQVTPCTSKKQQKQIANMPASVLHSPPLSTRNCVN